MTLTGAKAFVDTNILLRAMMPSMQLHIEAEGLIQKSWENDVVLWVSRQVLREYLVQATHSNNFSPPLTINQVISQIHLITSLFRVADETPAVTAQLLMLQTYPTRGKQIHDANLVATMLVNDIDTLLTINTADFTRYADKIKLIPLGQKSWFSSCNLC